MQFSTIVLSLALAATSMAQSQLPDGQVQAPTSQVTVPTTTAAGVSQITDGQIQAPTSTAAVVSQITDGQVQVGTASAVPLPSPNGTFTTSIPSPSAFTGGASFASWSNEIAVAAIGAAAGFALL
ncbi:MAG: hypothetical protein Q9163_001699 [Psora crenata]